MNLRKLVTSLAIASVVVIAGCKDDTFEENFGVCPVVESTSPLNGATEVPREAQVTVTFNEAMNPATINQTSFTLLGPDKVEGAMTYNTENHTLTFVPKSKLKYSTTYTGRVTTSVKDLLGNALQKDYVWTFTTADLISPVVTSTNPVLNATGVTLDKAIAATFSVPMDPQTINTTTFTLKQGATAVAGTVTYSGTTAIFTPTSNLTANTVYTGTITTGALNNEGNPLLSNYEWTFTTLAHNVPTVTATSPVHQATGVARNKVISATFSEAMNPATLTSASFTLKAGTTTIAGVISYNGTTASFNPTNDLAANTTYTAIITTAAKSSNDVALAGNHVWTFTTLAHSVPTVTSTDPTNQATGVALDKIVRATFSEAMNPATITATSFTLKAGSTTIVGVTSYNGNTASFNPTNNLAANTTYTATITTAAKSTNDVALAGNHVWTFTTVDNNTPPVIPPVTSPMGVNLKTAARFGIFAGVGISNNAGFSEIRNLDVGITPGVRSSVTGFPPAKVVNGAIYASDDIAPPGTAAMLLEAKQDLLEAYLFAKGASSPAPATVAGDQGGKTLAPGIYKTTSTLLIQAGDLTLDAKGDPNAVWIFQIASDFTTVGGAGGNIILTGGAQAKNIFWQVGSSATIGDNTSFKGNVLALTSITMNSGAKAVGRMLALNGAVVMTNTNIIEKP